MNSKTTPSGKPQQVIDPLAQMLIDGEKRPNFAKRNPEEVLNECLARLDARNDDDEFFSDIWEGKRPSTLSEALIEAIVLPSWERPTTWAELARWVKVRLHGVAPFTQSAMKSFLLELGRAMLANSELKNRVNTALFRNGQKPHIDTRLLYESTVGPSSDLVPTIIGDLEAADPELAELVLMNQFAVQPLEVLEQVTGRPHAELAGLLESGLESIYAEIQLALPG